MPARNRKSQNTRPDAADDLDLHADPDLEILDALGLEDEDLDAADQADATADDATDPAVNRKPDRRKSVVDTRMDTGLERRRGPGRRRSDFMKSAEEGEMSQEQFLFIKAVDAYKRVNDRPFPSWTEVLEIIRKLGYRKTCEMQLDIQGADDWIEPADAEAFPTRTCPEHEAATDVSEDDDFDVEIDDAFFNDAA